MSKSFKDILLQMERTPQDPKWHPEGDVLTHTAILISDLTFVTRKKGGIEILVAALFHDTGKIDTTERHPDGRVTSYKHEERSVEIAREFLPLIFPAMDEAWILFFIKHHMRFKFFDDMSEKKKAKLLAEALEHDRRRRMAEGTTFRLLTLFEQLDSGRRQVERHGPEERARMKEGLKKSIPLLAKAEFISRRKLEVSL